MENITFNDKDNIDSIKQKKHDTQLTHFLKLNATNPDVRDLYYYQMPLFYVWKRRKHMWMPRKK